MSVWDKEYYIEGLSISNQPIPFKNQFIYHPIIKDVFNYGEDEFTKDHILLWCNSISASSILSENDLIKGLNLNIFDLYLMNNGERTKLLNSLKYYLKLTDNDIIFNHNDMGTPYFYIDQDVVNRINNTEYIVEEKCIWTSKDLLEMQKIITFITNTKVLSKEDIKVKDDEEDEYDMDSLINDPELMAKFQDIIGINKINDYKKMKEQEKYTKIFNIFRYVLLVGHFTREELLSWNIYSLYDMYQSLQINDSYQFNSRLASSGMCDCKGVDLSSLPKRILK